MKRVLDNTIRREVYTLIEAAHALNVGRNEFEERFVKTGLLRPVVYDAKQGRKLLFDYEDIRKLIESRKRDMLPEFFEDKYKRKKGAAA